MNELELKGKWAKKASYFLSNLSSEEKNNALRNINKKLVERSEEIIKANSLDIYNAMEKGTSKAMLDRLSLDKSRIEDIAQGVLNIVSLNDPIGEVTSMFKRPNGLKIGVQRVPIGVIGIIYEARPNVTVDAAALCLKSGNAVILRGGKEAINSNLKIVEIMAEFLTPSMSLAPYLWPVMTAKPFVNPTITKVIKKNNGATAPTAAKASTPRVLPTITRSAILYSCWKMFPINNGTEKSKMCLRGLPFVISVIIKFFLK